jgi:hypothetical protein
MMLLRPCTAWIRQLAAFAALLATWQAAGRAELLILAGVLLGVVAALARFVAS